MLRKTLIGAGFMLALLLLSANVFAHRAKTILTEVTYNETSRRLEVVHRTHFHDASTVLAALLDDPSASPFEIEGHAALLLYSEEHFQLATKGEPVLLTSIGAEVDGDHIYLYLESDPMDAPKELLVYNSLFHDFYPDQTNLTNVKVGDILRTVVFRDGDDAKITLF